MKKLAQLNGIGRQACMGLAALLSMLDNFSMAGAEHKYTTSVSGSVARRAERKAERQNVRYNRMHNRKGVRI